ncbi:ubiquitin D-like, partial [Meles meles]|uniref:ubiquitin D-like n=1 Tax=Meles meles TaxID=9662 RepID=UPI001E69A801
RSLRFPKRSSPKGRDTACCIGAGWRSRARRGQWCKVAGVPGTLVCGLLAFIVQVTVSSEGRTSVTFTANSGDRVRKINKHVRAKTKIPVQDQVLLLGSKMLKPQRRLSSYSIDKETTVHLTLKVVKPSEDELPVTLVQAGDGGQGHLLQVRRSSSVAQEKQMIETKTAIAPEQQIVTCNGKRLEDGKTMADYGIRRGTALWLADYCIGG